ncbi:MAG: hypothetical protein R2794_08625 [Chitinophagales bacterium]
MKIYRIILGAYLVMMAVVVMRCEKVTEISELVKNTEKMQIVFYADGEPVTYYDVTDKEEIRAFRKYISSDDSPMLQCPMDGRLIFFMQEDVAPGSKNSIGMDFSLQGDCHIITYPYGGVMQTKKLSAAGVEYLKKKMQE